MRRAVVLFLLAGCARPSVTSAPVEPERALPPPAAAEPERRAACNLEADYPSITPDEQKARVAAFLAQNGGDWKIEPATDLDGVFGFIRRATRLDLPKPAPGAATDVERIGRAFFEKNAAFFGFARADIERATFTFDGGGNLAVSRPVFGLEAYVPPPLRVVNVSYSVRDGRVVGFYSLSSSLPLELDLCNEPPSLPSLRNVIGRELFYVPHVYVQTEPPKPMGKVDRESIAKREPVVFERFDESGKSFIVGWRLIVRRGGYEWSFTVSAADGTLLEERH